MSQSPYTKATIVYKRTLRLFFSRYLFIFVIQLLYVNFSRIKKNHFFIPMFIYTYFFNSNSCSQKKTEK